jgi:hypothetical protein
MLMYQGSAAQLGHLGECLSTEHQTGAVLRLSVTATPASVGFLEDGLQTLGVLSLP